MELDMVERTDIALYSIACIRLGYYTLPKIYDDRLYDKIVVERSRLERLFEKHWIKNITVEYYTALFNWIKDNLIDLRNPELFVGDYTNPINHPQKTIDVTQHSLIMYTNPKYSE